MSAESKNAAPSLPSLWTCQTDELTLQAGANSSSFFLLSGKNKKTNLLRPKQANRGFVSQRCLHQLPWRIPTKLLKNLIRSSTSHVICLCVILAPSLSASVLLIRLTVTKDSDGNNQATAAWMMAGKPWCGSTENCGQKTKKQFWKLQGAHAFRCRTGCWKQRGEHVLYLC